MYWAGCHPRRGVLLCLRRHIRPAVPQAAADGRRDRPGDDGSGHGAAARALHRSAVGTADARHRRVGCRRVGGHILHGARLSALLSYSGYRRCHQSSAGDVADAGWRTASWYGYSRRAYPRRRLRRHGPDRVRPDDDRWPAVGAIPVSACRGMPPPAELSVRSKMARVIYQYDTRRPRESARKRGSRLSAQEFAVPRFPLSRE